MTMAMKNPPRRTTIRGQKHLLAYITPEEADILKAMGGSGKPGPMGIPAFYDNDRPGMGGEGEMGDRGGFGGDDNAGGEGSSGRGGPRGGRGGGRASAGMDTARGGGGGGDGGAAAADRARQAAQDKAIKAEIENRQAYEATMRGISPGQATAMFGDARMAGRGFTSADIDRVLGNATVSRAALAGMLPELQERARRGQQISSLFGALSPVQTAIKGIFGLPQSRTSYDDLSTLLGMPGSRIQSGGFFGPDLALAAPTGGVGAFGTPANLSQGYFGQITYTGMPNDEYTGPYSVLVNPRDPNMGGEAAEEDRQLLPTQTNPVTGQEECPEGYIFDEDLQACRMGGGGAKTKPYTGDLYGRMGLLDIAPTGLGMFKERFGAGFGTPSEFDAANLAFRRSGGVTRPYEGYTLLS